MGLRSKRKGTRRELELATQLCGKRQPHSGALAGIFGPNMAGDVVLPSGLRFEREARKDGFRQLYQWLERVDALALKADRRPWLVVVPLDQLREVAGQMGAEDEQEAAYQGAVEGGVERHAAALDCHMGRALAIRCKNSRRCGLSGATRH